MNTWNTFEDEAYTFPNLCAKCAAPEPTECWRLKYYEVEFPEGRPVTPYDQKPRNYNTYVTNVPVCKECLAGINRRRRLCWLLGAAVGTVFGCSLLMYMDKLPQYEGQALYLTPFVMGLFPALVVGYVLKLIFVDALSFAKYNGREQKLNFNNKEFQAQFDRLNFQYSALTGKYADGARAW